MSVAEGLLLIGGAFIAGVVNTLAGGASILTVPLLVLIGLPGNVANGTNRVGVLVQNVVAAWRFRAEGVSGFRKSTPALLPIALGSLAGAVAISRVPDKTFERLFGLVMVLLLIPMFRSQALSRTASSVTRGWSAPVSFLVFFAIGLYGGMFQAGVGIALLLALAYTGYDLIRANSIKVVVNGVLTLVAVPVFAVQHQVAWLPAALLAVGFAIGSSLGVRIAIRGGERVIRLVLAASVIGLAGRMLGLY